MGSSQWEGKRKLGDAYPGVQSPRAASGTHHFSHSTWQHLTAREADKCRVAWQPCAQLRLCYYRRKGEQNSWTVKSSHYIVNGWMNEWVNEWVNTVLSASTGQAPFALTFSGFLPRPPKSIMEHSMPNNQGQMSSYVLRQLAPVLLNLLICVLRAPRKIN